MDKKIPDTKDHGEKKNSAQFFKTDLKDGVLMCNILSGKAFVSDIPEFLKKLKKISDDSGVYIICLNEENIAGTDHVKAAIKHASRSFFEDKPISKSFEMEVLLYTGGTRQCSEAGIFGLMKGENEIYTCICRYEKKSGILEEEIPEFLEYDEIFDKTKDSLCEIITFSDSLPLEMSTEKKERLKKIFEITNAEIKCTGEERFSEIVIERVALLDVNK
ncbi:hypothetical protein F1737_11090 [Methanoplanus sp. FWC-SCC4]|uniref:Uncharacterized protein n=1 Tax=Methanochimaera problematica TaxID=2609417 RepID=A0AA97FDY1_9EURY|nr:KEOPS complex subunit Cgi121 [Methanoplanus sp. FWC-SCC4]WOF17184.1 hypothetical protein F1737_11090 [Methanoplanus sp. FWC-SCC4]